MLTCPSCGEQNPERARFCMACTAPLVPAEAPLDVRRTVTIVFSDLAGSTALGERLDPEALREVMTEYFSRMRAALEGHGGVVEKYIGDAVMAVFGLPRAHEDDALRAVRAIADMRHALESLNSELEARYGVRLTNRTGVHTGEVVAGDASTGQRLATGDAVNTAARLEQAAPHGEVLIGDPTFRLVRDAVVVEPVDPIAAKGKAEPVPAYRLVQVKARSEGYARRLDVPLVGRQHEFHSLIEAFEETVAEGASRLITVIGEPGVGKSRLISEFVSTVADRARVLRGRCLSYGEGVTFWPLAEAVKQAAGVTDADSPEEARDRIAALLRGADQGQRVADRLSSAIGLASTPYPVEETFWAARKFFEHLAAERALVIEFDDIHWAEPTLLDLIEHVAERTTRPVLLLCAARPELSETRSGWGAGVAGSSQVSLQRLSDAEVGELTSGLLGSLSIPLEAQAEVVRASQGNPLFVEQMLSMWTDDGLLSRQNGGWILTAAPADLSVPSSIGALLTARLDRLADHERALVQRASVIGQVFSRAGISALVPEAEGAQVEPTLRSLTMKRFIEPTDELEPGGYRFAHVLVRDAAYAGILKRTRAEIHERFGDWLEGGSGDRRLELEEMVGFHLEQAQRYRTELGLPDEHAMRLASRAGKLLWSAGQRALAQGDVPAAGNLLARARSLTPESAPDRCELDADLALAQVYAGEPDEARRLFDQVLERAHRDGRPDLEIRAMYHRADIDDRYIFDDAAGDVARMLPTIERLRDPLASARLHALRTVVHWTRGEGAVAYEACLEAARYAEAAGDRAEERKIVAGLAGLAFVGPVHATEGVRICAQVFDRVRATSPAACFTLIYWAGLTSMGGDFHAARELLSRARAIQTEFSLNRWLPLFTAMSGWVELTAEDPEAARRVLVEGIREIETTSVREDVGLLMVLLARAHHACGDHEEARRCLPHELGYVDMTFGADRDGIRARLAVGADPEGAERLAREAVASAEKTDFPNVRADAAVDLAEVLLSVRRPSDAVPLLERAVALYEGKGNVPAATRTRRRLDSLGRSSD